ncbi:MAG: hypothetical protein HQL30_01840 [Candidatus Omnitrophica bacterium]|nr:hypothetical protein [Candidatus Omnitrophota bacterium]
MILYEEILREFNKQKVKYVIVGGIAFNILGGYRNTLDMDIITEMSDENLSKVTQILKKYGYKTKKASHEAHLLDTDKREKLVKNKNVKALNFYKNIKSYEQVDIILDTPVDYRMASKNHKKYKIGDISIPVISINDLIKMKISAARDKDIMDIEVLDHLRRRVK